MVAFQGWIGRPLATNTLYTLHPLFPPSHITKINPEYIKPRVGGLPASLCVVLLRTPHVFSFYAKIYYLVDKPIFLLIFRTSPTKLFWDLSVIFSTDRNPSIARPIFIRFIIISSGDEPLFLSSHYSEPSTRVRLPSLRQTNRSLKTTKWRPTLWYVTYTLYKLLSSFVL